MVDTVLQYLITANNQANQAFDQLKTRVEGVQGGLGGLVDGAKKASAGMADFMGAVSIAGEVLQVASKAYDVFVGSTMEYAKQVKDLGRTIGASAEESSMLIQAADDMEVSYGSLTAGLESAIRKGVEPSIAGIARLSDQYLSIQNPIERTRFLMENFGRAGADLGPLMEKGAAGIREMGEEARQMGQILDDEAIKKLEDYRQKIDTLGDKWQAITLKVGPPLIDILSSATGSFLTLADGANQINAALDKHSQDMLNTTKSYEEYTKEVNRAETQMKLGAAAVGAYLGPMSLLIGAQNILLHDTAIATEAEWKHVQALKAIEGQYIDSAAAALAYSQVVSTGATQGIDNGYNGWNPNRGANPTRENPTYEFLVPSGRATGGPMWAGITRVVGEDGPEPFTPSTGGVIGEVAASSSPISIQITSQSMFSLSDNAQAKRVLLPIIEEAVRAMKQNGKI